MSSYKKILPVLSFALCCTNCFSQSDRLVFQPVNNPVLQQYTIRSITTGTDGKLWLSTDNGLLCYDGNDVTVFQHNDNDPSSISSNNISKTYLDTKGNLYVINDLHEKNLSFMDGKTGKFTVIDVHHTAEDFRSMATPFAYSDLLIDDDNSIWLAAYYVGFFHHTKTKINSYHIDHRPPGKSTVYCIKKDVSDKDILWLGTEDGIYSFNKKTEELKRNFRNADSVDFSSVDLQITGMDVYSADSIWFTVDGKGIGCYNIKTGYYKMFTPSDEKSGITNNYLSIKQIQRKSRNEYYVSTGSSFPGIFNTYTHTFTFLEPASQSSPSVLLNNFLVDSAYNFWCVSYNRLYRGEPTKNKFGTVNFNTGKAEAVLDDAFKAIVWDKKQSVYYCAFEKTRRVFVLDSNYTLIKTIPFNDVNSKTDTINSTGINDLAIDNKNRLWVCSNSLYMYDKVSRKVVPSYAIYPGLLFKEQQFQNMVMRGEYIYLQPSNFFCRAIYRFNTNTLTYDSIILPGEIAKDKNNEHQPVKLLNYLVLDKKGENAYIGYSKFSLFGYTDCLIQFNLKTKRARRVVKVANVEHNELSNLFKYALDNNDRIWVETENGINVFEPDGLKMVSKIDSEGEPFSNQLYNMPDADIMCRLYSRGIILYDYRNDKQIHLTLNDGLISSTNSGVACINNMLFVGASNYIQYLPIASAIKPKIPKNCYLSSIQIFNKPYLTDTLAEYLHILNLPHNQNFITFTFSSLEFKQTERLAYRYKLDGVDKEWVYVNHLNRIISYSDLKPGKYTFYAQVKNADGHWSNHDVHLLMNIVPAWWQTNLFNALFFLSIILGTYSFVRWRIRSIRTQEQLKGKYEKELLELEAKALRAQMNPHFIFNCMNSIKALIQKGEQEKSILYLTTFAKLIRTVFQNSDKREITLYDEIETCRLYTQLESMRFGDKFIYDFGIDETLDLKSVMVPALIIQPFIENAIWHGIMLKEEGGVVTVNIDKWDHTIRCIIDDNGIGRETSMQNKFLSKDLTTHQSKGEHLTQVRLDLDNLLNERNASIEIIDKKDGNGKPGGTTVTLNFTEY